MQHEKTIMVYYRQGNKKHTHHTRRGTQEWNHWFNVYRCPVCGRCTSHRRKPIYCTGE